MLHPPDRQRWARLVDVSLPRWVPVRQMFPAPIEPDVAAAVRRELARPEIRSAFQPGMKVALGVGSRGLASLRTLVATTVTVLKEADCEPFIVPAMGSHGGATAEGQQEVLAGYGVSEATVGAPVRSSMETVQIGQVDGVPFYFDRLALGADLVIPINRVKPHTSFRGPVESGLLKMLAVGFGKHAGATALHSAGFGRLSLRLDAARDILCTHTPFGFGLATVENAAHQVALVEAVPANDLATREPALLDLARGWMARLQFDRLDVLVVGAIGKNVSGTGMDPNVTGRSATGLPGTLEVAKIVVLDLTPETHGNATGLGMADVTTERVIEQLDLDATWINGLTSTSLANARIPIFLPNDQLAMQLAVKTCGRADPREARIAWIHSTMELEHIYVSEPLWNDIQDDSAFVLDGEAEAMPFTSDGMLQWTEAHSLSQHKHSST